MFPALRRAAAAHLFGAQLVLGVSGENSFLLCRPDEQWPESVSS